MKTILKYISIYLSISNQWHHQGQQHQHQKFHQSVVQRDHVVMIMPKNERMLASMCDTCKAGTLWSGGVICLKEIIWKNTLLRTKYFLCCHLLVTFARDTEISHLSVRGSEGQDDGRPSSPTMLSFPWGKDKHHLSNNFSHPDYLPESLLFWTIHRLQLLLIPGVVLLKLVVCVSFKLSWQEDHVARINLSIVSTSPSTVVDPLIFSKSTIKQIWLKISCSSFFSCLRF